MWSFSSIILIVFIVMIGIYIRANLRAREWAIFHAKNICKQYHVQLLDESIEIKQKKLKRSEFGILCWERTYSFEYSCDQISREKGQVILRGNILMHISIFESNTTIQNDSPLSTPSDQDNVIEFKNFKK